MWAIGGFEMFEFDMYNTGLQVIIDDFSGWAEKMLKAALEQAKTEIEQEELEFNGRWCDDGGRAVE